MTSLPGDVCADLATVPGHPELLYLAEYYGGQPYAYGRLLPDPTDPANLEKVSGRGLLLIQTFMDHVEHNPRGNQIVMTKRRS